MRNILLILCIFYFSGLSSQSVYAINKRSGKEILIDTGFVQFDIENKFFFNNTTIVIDSILKIDMPYKYIEVQDSFLLFEKTIGYFGFQNQPSILDSVNVGDTIKILLKDITNLHYCRCNKNIAIASIIIASLGAIGLLTSGVLFLTNDDALARIFLYSGLAAYLSGGTSIWLLTGRNYPSEKWEYVIR